MVKKSQIAAHQITYIFLIIIFSFVLLLGYSFVKDLGKKGEKVTLIVFKTELENDVNSVGYGGIKVVKYRVPEGIDKVCFSDYDGEAGIECGPELDCPAVGDGNEIIANAITDKTGENVFLLSGSIPDTMKIGKIAIDCCEFICVDVNKGRLKLKLEGVGQRTFVEGR